MKQFSAGIDVLLSRHRGWLSGRRIGLVSHAAAVDSKGCSSAERLFREGDLRLSCLFGPEHGFFGAAQAGVACRNARHPHFGIPIFSLYGDTRKPDAGMLADIDTLVFDMQDIAARPYTFVSTLRYVLEAAAVSGKEVVVADRPVPLPDVLDGPVAEESMSSFVAMVRTPMSYGMTPGETALWLKESLGIGVQVRVAEMEGYRREGRRGRDWPPWIPPSPGMRSWESAMCYTATVGFEALAAVDHGRATNLAFQVIGSEWMNGWETAGRLNAFGLPGVRFYAHCYAARPLDKDVRLLDGVRIVVTEPAVFRPVLTGVSVIRCLQDMYGTKQVWAAGPTRAGFFDKLFGTTSVRKGLLKGKDAKTISSQWNRGIAAFRRTRDACLLY